jgi:L-lactate dehydrogenase complex protein LldF
MKVADKVLSDPELYRIATASVSTALRIPPHFAIYNRLNAWCKHRDVPEAASETFHEWYKNHRLKGNEALGL